MDPTIDLAAIQNYKDQLAAAAEKTEDRLLQVETAGAIQDQVAASGAQTQQALLVAISSLMRFMAQHKQSVEVANQPDPISMAEVIEAVKENTEEIKASNERLTTLTGKESDFSAVIETLTRLEQAIDRSAASRPAPPTSMTIDNQPDLTPHFDGLNASIAGISSSMPAPIVNAPPPDLLPIQEQLAANSSKVLPPQLNLATYRAQDIDDADPDAQFIGFMNLDGYWYILKNDTKSNAMRYHFGYGNYENAWSIASALDYLPLQAAMQAIMDSKKTTKKVKK